MVKDEAIKLAVGNAFHNASIALAWQWVGK